MADETNFLDHLKTNILDYLVSRVQDDTLRSHISREVELLRGSRHFGLVFDRHLPESVRLTDYPIRKGVRVALRRGASPETWIVTEIAGETRDIAVLSGDGGERPVSELLVVREFNEPIYPGLSSVQKIAKGAPDDPWHVVINGENFHVLQALRSTHRRKVDMIYIDPPYNTGRDDWIYNDRYIDQNDRSKSSKWLSFMERRLIVARDLLKLTGFILISIDDREQAHLRLLMDQVFGTGNFVATFCWRTDGNLDNQAMVKINHEYIMMYARDSDQLVISGVKDPNLSKESKLFKDHIRNSVVKNGSKNPPSSILIPTGFPANFAEGVIPARTNKYPNYDQDVCVADHHVAGPVTATTGWANASLLRSFIEGGFKPVLDSKGQVTVFELTHTGTIENVKVRRSDQHHILTVLTNLGTVETAGNALRTIGCEFPYPKPVPLIKYLCSFAPNDGVILDYFGGSGTTTEAVMQLNLADGGARQSLLVTNNEVGSTLAKKLRGAGIQVGDPAWEENGVFESVCRPRIATVTSGKRPDGTHHSDGLSANVEMFNLKYLDPTAVRRGREFRAIAPFLWLQGGACGERIEATAEEGWALTETYGVLFDIDTLVTFAEAVSNAATAGEPPQVLFVITDSLAEYQEAVERLPAGMETIQFYDDYLSRCAFNFSGTIQ